MRTLLVFALMIALADACAAATPSLLEATIDGKVHQGKLVGRDDKICWVMGRNGRLMRLEIDSIDKLETVAARFRPLTIAEMRDSVRREYGKQFEVVGSGKYVVCAPPQQAGQYARLFDRMYRSVHHYFSRRGFRLDEPEFPLVAIVLPDREAFAKQCERDGIRSGSGLLGYYHPDSNRVALFDPDNETPQAVGSPGPPFQSEQARLLARHFVEPDQLPGDVDSPLNSDRLHGRPSAGVIEADLQATIVHETTHQVAFNIGLHTRVGKNPKWVVEGLASAFEVASMYDGADGDSQRDRMNPTRFVWFMNFMATRRKPHSLSEFIASDRMFLLANQDAYAESWALTFFLLETRPSKYAAYLREVAARDSMSDYPPEDRLGDFCGIFGKNLEQFEAEFLRFFERFK